MVGGVLSTDKGLALGLGFYGRGKESWRWFILIVIYFLPIRIPWMPPWYVWLALLLSLVTAVVVVEGRRRY